MKTPNSRLSSTVMRPCLPLIVLWLLVPWLAVAGSWTPLVNKETDATRGLGPMLLLSDGTVMAQYFGGTKWYKLTPDSHGSYINGSWTNLNPMISGNRQYHSSAVLRDGRVFVAGAELGPGWNSAEVYDPANNSWTYVSIPNGLINTNNVINAAGDNTAGFSDSPCIILPDGTVMVAPIFPVTNNATVIYNPVTGAITGGPIALGGQKSQNETSWVKLPDDSILTIDKSSLNSERYIPSLGQWNSDANLPIQLYSNTGSEIGAGFLVSDGRAVFLGGNGNTAFYTPSGGASNGHWTQGTSMPSGLVARDTPAAMMANGKILCALSAGANAIGNETPVFFYEFDPLANSGNGLFTPVGSPQNPAVGSSDTNNISDFYTMLVLPDGNILFSDAAFNTAGSTLYVYQPDCCPVPEGKPAISSITANGNGSYHLIGTGLNGISQGAAFGDDNQMDSNYPLVRVNDGSGSIYCLPTYNWSSTGVKTGNLPVSTEFFAFQRLVPALSYSLVAVANGISSDPVTFYGPVWVDVNSGDPTQLGSFDFPYHTLALGISAVPATGTINIKTSGHTAETMTITKPMTIVAVGGPVTIGQ